MKICTIRTTTRIITRTETRTSRTRTVKTAIKITAKTKIRISKTRTTAKKTPPKKPMAFSAVFYITITNLFNLKKYS